MFVDVGQTAEVEDGGEEEEESGEICGQMSVLHGGAGSEERKGGEWPYLEAREYNRLVMMIVILIYLNEATIIL